MLTLLKPGGRLVIVHQPRGQRATDDASREFARRTVDTLEQAGFVNVRVEYHCRRSSPASLPSGLSGPSGPSQPPVRTRICPMDAFLSADGLIALDDPYVSRIVLGIDNVIFISILAGKLPADQQQRARADSPGDGHAGPAAAVDHVDHAAHRRRYSRLRPRLLRARPDPAGRWPVPVGKATLEIHDKLEGGRHASEKVVPRWRGDRSDHGARHRLLARLGDHRRRHGQRHSVMVTAVVLAVAV